MGYSMINFNQYLIPIETEDIAYESNFKGISKSIIAGLSENVPYLAGFVAAFSGLFALTVVTAKTITAIDDKKREKRIANLTEGEIESYKNFKESWFPKIADFLNSVSKDLVSINKIHDTDNYFDIDK